MGKVSIITVVRNRVGQIDHCLNSVFEQSYADIEHVLVDGASTDGTLEKLNKYAVSTPYKSFVFSEPANGIYSAINYGIKMCSGDIVGILHSDDTYYNSDVLKLVGHVFESNPGIDFLYGDIVFCRSDKSFHSFRSSHPFYVFGVGLGFMPAHTSLFVRRSVFDDVGYYDPDYHIAGDFDFFVRLARFKSLRGFYLRKILIKMEVGGASTSGLKSKFRIFSEKVKIFAHHEYSWPYLRALARYVLPLAFPIIWFVRGHKRGG